MPRLLVACLATLAVGCGATTATPQPTTALWTPPPDWLTVSNAEGSIQLTIPPYILVFDRMGSIFANEAPPPGETEIPIQLWAQGPRIEDGPREGETMVAWIERRFPAPGRRAPTVTPVSLPVGAGVRYERIDGFGTPKPWRIVIFALETPRGAAWLMIDGPPDKWAARADDLERIPMLFRLR